MQNKRSRTLFSTVAVSFVFLINNLSAAAQQGGQLFDNSGRNISRDTADAITLMNEGSQMLHDNKNAEACFRLERAVQLAPQLPDAHYNYGIALTKMSRNEEAAQQFQEATRLNPSMASAWLNLGAVYQMMGQIENALGAYNEFCTRFPDNSETPKIMSLVQGLANEMARSGGVRPAQKQPSQTSGAQQGFGQGQAQQGFGQGQAQQGFGQGQAQQGFGQGQAQQGFGQGQAQ